MPPSVVRSTRPRTRLPSLAALPVLVLAACASGSGGMPATGGNGLDIATIRDLIANHYVDAVFEARDEASARRAFHPSFQLFVLDDGELLVVSLDAWMEHLGLDGERSMEEVRHEVGFIDVAGTTAIARTELFVDGEHVYTDYFSLYRFPTTGWQIVAKTFQSRP